MLRTQILTVLLLTISNVFMTFAWYGHLKFKQSPLWLAILASWLIALFEYCFQVPANRIGSGVLTAVQLKVLQEVITLIVFGVVAVTYLGESIRWNHILAFGLIAVAVFLVQSDRKPADGNDVHRTTTAERPIDPVAG
ncbi:MAG TPA: DMT family protein [Planctomycetaceae bacterium]|jgi:uncharacterized protein (DUF486 family)|nr:DMT family protein [Planctomycetaceae bacterium SH412]HTN00958.1 DMT family protein [Planctomycetaceae bacterium]